MRRFLFFVLAILFAPVSSLPQTGLPPFGSLDRVGLEVRNNQNLNVVLGIPITSNVGRGMSLDFSIAYNTLNWQPISGGWTPNNSSNPGATWGWQPNLNAGYTHFLTTNSQGLCGTGNNQND